MTGLRNKLKQRRREAILSTAEKLFRKQGYSSTNIEDIAENAEVSIGTIYSYFGSKGGIMHELTIPMRENMEKRAEKVLETEYDTAHEAISAFFVAYQFEDDWKGQNILKAFDPTRASKDKHLLQSMDDIEGMIKRQASTLLSKLADQGKFNKDINREDVIFILYTILLRHFHGFISDEFETYEDMITIFQRRLKALMADWS